ncbi:Protein-L-isoaspartate O-methyltransferase [uncultured archaeon]|nr:Protein-L-isoaspartate O-methyltransferase [uncultured archaeon]
MADFDWQRRRLITQLERQGIVRSPAVRDALMRVPRHLFVPDEVRQNAYEDCPLPVGLGQTISAPHMVALMTESLDVKPGQNVLEVGCGSGYQAAVLSVLLNGEGSLVTVERIPELADLARKRLADLGYGNVKVVVGDGSLGWPSDAPFDRVLVTAGAPGVPVALVSQLKVGGMLLVPVGGRGFQELFLVEKSGAGVSRRSLGGVVFVPLVGEDGW